MTEFKEGCVAAELLGESRLTIKSNTRRFFDYHEALAFDMTDGQHTFLDLLKIGADKNVSVASTARGLGVSHKVLTKVFTTACIPILSSREATKLKWKDEEFRTKKVEQGRSMLADPDHKAKMQAGFITKMEDPDYIAWLAEQGRVQMEDPEQRASMREGIQRKWEEPAYRTKMVQLHTTRMADATTRERMSAQAQEQWADPDLLAWRSEQTKIQMTDPAAREKIRIGLRRKWQDSKYRKEKVEQLRAIWRNPEYRARMSELGRSRYQDPDFRKAFSAGVLRALKEGRYNIPTIHGTRRDVGYAHSAWEANIARVLIFLGREFINHEWISLSDGSQLELDFITLKSDNTFTIYEIMAYPLKDPEGWRKLKLAEQEYPDLNIRPITEKMYKKLEKRFRNRINNSDFCGWEDKSQNLRSNPEKFA